MCSCVHAHTFSKKKNNIHSTFGEFSDRDAGFYQVQKGENRWWDSNDFNAHIVCWHQTKPPLKRGFFASLSWGKCLTPIPPLKKIVVCFHVKYVLEGGRCFLMRGTQKGWKGYSFYYLLWQLTVFVLFFVFFLIHRRWWTPTRDWPIKRLCFGKFRTETPCAQRYVKKKKKHILHSLTNAHAHAHTLTHTHTHNTLFLFFTRACHIHIHTIYTHSLSFFAPTGIFLVFFLSTLVWQYMGAL